MRAYRRLLSPALATQLRAAATKAAKKLSSSPKKAQPACDAAATCPPPTRVARHPASGQEVSFSSEPHEYRLGGQRLRGVSELLDRYFPFDAEGISADLAVRRGVPQADILEEWRLRAVLGTNVHSAIEAKIRTMLSPSTSAAAATVGGDAVETVERQEEYVTAALRGVDRLLRDYEPLAAEVMMVSPDLRVAGTVDFIGRNRRTGALLVGDWKTVGSAGGSNSAFVGFGQPGTAGGAPVDVSDFWVRNHKSQTSGRGYGGFRFGGFEEPCPAPLGHLPKSKMYRYAVQLLIYGHLLVREGYASALSPGINVKAPLEYGLVVVGPMQSWGAAPMGRGKGAKTPAAQLDPIHAKFVRVTPQTISGGAASSELSPEGLIAAVLSPEDAEAAVSGP